MFPGCRFGRCWCSPVAALVGACVPYCRPSLFVALISGPKTAPVFGAVPTSVSPLCVARLPQTPLPCSGQQSLAVGPEPKAILRDVLPGCCAEAFRKLSLLIGTVSNPLCHVVFLCLPARFSKTKNVCITRVQCKIWLAQVPIFDSNSLLFAFGIVLHKDCGHNTKL